MTQNIYNISIVKLTVLMLNQNIKGIDLRNVDYIMAMIL